MIKLTRFFEVPFDDPEISLAELLAYVTDHLQRMIANNPGGELDGRIAATSAALALVLACASDDQSKLGLRKARKQVKDAFLKELPKKVAKIGAAVGARYAPNAPEMTVCFPQGRNVFNTSTDDQVAKHLQTLVTALEGYQPDLAVALAEANGLKTTWAAVYADSEVSTGAKTTTEEAIQLARKNLQLMCFLNVLKLAEMFARQPEKAEVYMRQSLLEDHPQGGDEEPPTPTPPGP